MGKNNHEELLGGAPEATSNKQTVEDNLLGRPHVAEKSFAPEAKKDALAPKTPEERFAELQRLTSVYLSEDDEAMLAKAFRFASEAHEGQCRKSGEPFVAHPVEVAIILADLRMDVETLCAALLHDIVEDTSVTRDQVEAEFNPQVAQLVEGVTKITRIEVESLTDEQAATIRKMFVAMSKDIRVIVIKLADRLHNMRTLKYMREDKQKRIARETIEIYAPLANRLGIRVPGRVIAYHDHNERDKADGLLDQVEQGATVLVVSDAGMPTINDPGLAIVRRAIERGLPVTCAPGPSAVLDALCLSGLPTDRFCYEGFLPRKHSERVQHLRALKSERRTIVFYETLHRIDESMADLLDVLGPNRKMALCRELTKDYEQIRRGTIAEIRQSVVDDPPRGEMVLVIAGASEEEADAAAPATLSIEDLAVLSVDRAQEDNLRIKDAISQVVAEHPLSDGSLANRKQVYNAVLAMKG